jgi:putative glutamine amidotransferase
MRRMRPVIGITPDEGRTVQRPGRPSVRRYELKNAYAAAVWNAGGLPVLLPYEIHPPEGLAQLVGLLDGLVVSGGGFDVPPSEYGEPLLPETRELNPTRSSFERDLLKAALAAELPVLGICGGMQLLNVVLGGTLIQDLATQRPGPLAHEQPHDPAEAWHPVEIAPGSRLSRIVGAAPMPANSTHHQAVKVLGAGLVASGRTSDGLVEAIERSDGAFVLGVQWHPEMLQEARNQAIYAALVEAAA